MTVSDSIETYLNLFLPQFPAVPSLLPGLLRMLGTESFGMWNFDL